MKKITINIFFTLILSVVAIVSCQNDDLPKANFDTSSVTNINATLSHEKATLTWAKPVKDEPTGYRITWTPDGKTIDVASTVTSYEIKGLKTNKDYIFSVQAVYENNGISGRKNITTTIPDEINLKAFPGPQFVQLQWNKPHREDLVGYELVTSVGSQVIQIDKEETLYIIQNLQNDTKYTFTLTPKYQDGAGYPIVQTATPGFVEMIVTPKVFVNSGAKVEFSYNPVFLLNQQIATYSWDFKDGTTDSTQNPSHTFTRPGQYEVSLEITDVKGNKYSSKKLINVVGINWEYNVSKDIKGVVAARGSDGTLYIGDSAGSFYAFNSDGTKKWSLSLTTSTGNQEIYDGCPAIGADGTVYVTSQNGNLYAISQNGSLKWTFTIDVTSATSGIKAGAAIANDGTIYINDQVGRFYAINPDGTKKWSFAHTGGGDSSPAIATDGTIYFGSDDKNLYALNPDGSLKWKYTTGGIVDSSPSIGADGTVYFGSADNKLYAVKSDGTLRWTYGFNAEKTFGAPTIGEDGTIFVGARDNKLYAISAGGSLKWAASFTKRFLFSSATLDANGNLYIGNEDGYLYAINQLDGTTVWSMNVGRIFSSATIGENGNIYIGTLVESTYVPAPATARFLSIYAVADKLADSPWPTKRGNANQTGHK